MSARAGRKAQPGSADTPWLVLAGLLGLAMAVVLIWWAAALTDPQVRDAGAGLDPVNLIIGQATGHVPVNGVQLLVFGTGTTLLLGVAVLAVIVWARSQASGSRVDRLAGAMSRAKDFDEMTPKAQQHDAERLGAETAGPGVALAGLVNNGAELRASWEWVQTFIMGPRAGKTSCVCVPQIIEPDAPVLATSNKRDIVDLTRGPRSEKGVVWVQDPQDIIGEPASWWWNPLSFVEDMETAEKLADVFISSATSAGGKQDAYFESDGKRLLSHMLYAAAADARPITEVFKWGLDPDDETPVNCLYQHGQYDLATALC